MSLETCLTCDVLYWLVAEEALQDFFDFRFDEGGEGFRLVYEHVGEVPSFEVMEDYSDYGFGLAVAVEWTEGGAKVGEGFAHGVG